MRLISRLILRKKGWFDVSKLNFSEIKDINNSIQKLITFKFLISSGDPQINCLNPDFMGCLLKDDLQRIVLKCGLKINVKGGKATNSKIINSILLQVAKQKTVFGKILSKSPHFISKFHKTIGKWVSFSEKVKIFFEKCHVLFYLNRNNSMQKSVLSQIGKISFPNYEIDESKSCIFKNVEEFEKYLEAIRLYEEFEECVIEGNEKTISEKGMELLETAQKSHVYFLCFVCKNMVYTHRTQRKRSKKRRKRKEIICKSL